jgi:putative glycosyltransferase (TIGR04372 family)
MVLDLASLGPVAKPDYSNPGETEDNPFIIFGIFTSRALGDFVINNIIAGSIKKLFKHSKLYVYCQLDRKYKKNIIQMNPYVDRAFFMEQNASLAIDNFGLFGDVFSMGWKVPDFITRAASWHSLKCNAPNLILAPSTMYEDSLGAFESPARLTIRRDRVEGLTRRLVEKGVDPDRWYAVIHYREPTYALRPARPMRDASAEPFIDLTNRIINDLGGQVVRVGHQGMTPFPPRRDFVDLAIEEDDIFNLQAFAISRARFMVGVSTGPLQVASAFGTPAASTNSVIPRGNPGCWNPHDLCLHRNVFLADGTRIPQSDAVEHGLMSAGILKRLAREKGLIVLENSAEELFEVARRLADRSGEVSGWRTPVLEPYPEHHVPNCFATPVRKPAPVPVVEYPDLATAEFLVRNGVNHEQGG